MDEIIEGGMALIASLDAFGENILEFGAQGEDQGDIGRGGRHVFLMIFEKLDKIEIIAAGGCGCGALESAFRDGKQGEAWRQGEGFLGTGEQDIDAEGIFLYGQDGEGRDGIDNADDLGKFADYGHDISERIHGAGGSFVMDEGEGVELAGGEVFADILGIDWGAPLILKRLGFEAAARGDIEPFIGKSAGADIEYLALAEIAQSAFHDAPCGGGGKKNGIAGKEKRLKARLHGFVQLDKVGAAVAENGRSHGLIGLGGDLNGAGDEEFVAHDVMVVEKWAKGIGKVAICWGVKGGVDGVRVGGGANRLG